MNTNIQPKKEDVQKRRGNAINPPSAGVTPNALPEVQTRIEKENAHTGVSTSNVFTYPQNQSPKNAHWYALRCTYGCERKAYEYLCRKGIKAFYPTISRKKISNGKVEYLSESRLPNLLFAFGSFEQLKLFVYDNYHEETKHLRFYYHVYHNGIKEPIIVPERQMDSLMKICDVESEDIQLDPFAVEKFKTGQLVKITAGPFVGVEGVAKRYKGQQRVAIVIEGLCTITTAYIPSAYLQPSL